MSRTHRSPDAPYYRDKHIQKNGVRDGKARRDAEHHDSNAGANRTFKFMRAARTNSRNLTEKEMRNELRIRKDYGRRIYGWRHDIITVFVLDKYGRQVQKFYSKD